MSPGVCTRLRWLTIDYSPHPAERPFLERAQTRREREVETPLQCRATGRANVACR